MKNFPLREFDSEGLDSDQIIERKERNGASEGNCLYCICGII